MNGLLVINKPIGVTSRDVVNDIQRVLRQLAETHHSRLASPEDLGKGALNSRLPVPKCGHAGTLDPLATGVLVVACGAATRLIEYVQEQTKHYRATFQLGLETDTEDSTGSTIGTGDWQRVTLPEVQEAFAAQVGRIMQIPPAFSAIRIAGKRAYDLARSGQDVELAPRPINIHSIEVEAFTPPFVTVNVVCGSGTYVRSIGRDVGRTMGCGATMTALSREAIGPFRIADAVAPSKVTAELLTGFLRSVDEAVVHLKRLEVDAQLEYRLRCGQRIDFPELIGRTGIVALCRPRLINEQSVDEKVHESPTSALIGIGELTVAEAGTVAPYLILPPW
jgi:tRNA pseudouridine55 synthase